MKDNEPLLVGSISGVLAGFIALSIYYAVSDREWLLMIPAIGALLIIIKFAVKVRKDLSGR